MSKRKFNIIANILLLLCLSFSSLDAFVIKSKPQVAKKAAEETLKKAHIEKEGVVQTKPDPYKPRPDGIVPPAGEPARVRSFGDYHPFRSFFDEHPATDARKAELRKVIVQLWKNVTKNNSVKGEIEKLTFVQELHFVAVKKALHEVLGAEKSADGALLEALKKEVAGLGDFTIVSQMNHDAAMDYILKFIKIFQNAIQALIRDADKLDAVSDAPVEKKESHLLFKENAALRGKVSKLVSLDFFPDSLCQGNVPDCALYAIYNAVCKVNEKLGFPDPALTFDNRKRCDELRVLWRRLAETKGDTELAGGVSNLGTELILDTLFEGKGGIATKALFEACKKHIVTLEDVVIKTSPLLFLDLEYQMRTPEFQQNVEAFKAQKSDYLIVMYGNDIEDLWGFSKSGDGHGTILVFTWKDKAKGEIAAEFIDSNNIVPKRDFIKLLYKGILQTTLLPREKELALMIRLHAEGAWYIRAAAQGDFAYKSLKAQQLEKELPACYQVRKLALSLKGTSQEDAMWMLFTHISVAGGELVSAGIVSSTTALDGAADGEKDEVDTEIPFDQKTYKSLQFCKNKALALFGNKLKGKLRLITIADLLPAQQEIFKKFAFVYSFLNDVIKYKTQVTEALEDDAIRPAFKGAVADAFTTISTQFLAADGATTKIEETVHEVFVPFFKGLAEKHRLLGAHDLDFLEDEDATSEEGLGRKEETAEPVPTPVPKRPELASDARKSLTDIQKIVIQANPFYKQYETVWKSSYHGTLARTGGNKDITSCLVVENAAGPALTVIHPAPINYGEVLAIAQQCSHPLDMTVGDKDKGFVGVFNTHLIEVIKDYNRRYPKGLLSAPEPAPAEVPKGKVPVPPIYKDGKLYGEVWEDVWAGPFSVFNDDGVFKDEILENREITAEDREKVKSRFKEVVNLTKFSREKTIQLLRDLLHDHRAFGSVYLDPDKNPLEYHRYPLKIEKLFGEVVENVIQELMSPADPTKPKPDAKKDEPVVSDDDIVNDPYWGDYVLNRDAVYSRVADKQNGKLDWLRLLLKSEESQKSKYKKIEENEEHRLQKTGAVTFKAVKDALEIVLMSRIMYRKYINGLLSVHRRYMPSLERIFKANFGNDLPLHAYCDLEFLRIYEQALNDITVPRSFMEEGDHEDEGHGMYICEPRIDTYHAVIKKHSNKWVRSGDGLTYEMVKGALLKRFDAPGAMPFKCLMQWYYSCRYPLFGFYDSGARFMFGGIRTFSIYYKQVLEELLGEFCKGKEALAPEPAEPPLPEAKRPVPAEGEADDWDDFVGASEPVPAPPAPEPPAPAVAPNPFDNEEWWNEAQEKRAEEVAAKDKEELAREETAVVPAPVPTPPAGPRPLTREEILYKNFPYLRFITTGWQVGKPFPVIRTP